MYNTLVDIDESMILGLFEVFMVNWDVNDLTDSLFIY